MRPAAGVMLGLAIVAGAFAYWGMFTAAGGRRFDEMAGMIPFFASLASGVLLLAAAVTWLLARRK